MVPRDVSLVTDALQKLSLPERWSQLGQSMKKDKRCSQKTKARSIMRSPAKNVPGVNPKE